MSVSPKGLEFIAAWEGCQLGLYHDAAGYPTIGVGHLVVDDDPIERWRRDGIDEEEALRLLQLDVGHAEACIERYVRVELTAHQFDALASWTFNLGGRALRVSTLRKRLNQGEHDAVPGEMRRWNRAKGSVVEGLVKRREAEAWLWSTGDYSSRP